MRHIWLLIVSSELTLDGEKQHLQVPFLLESGKTTTHTMNNHTNCTTSVVQIPFLRRVFLLKTAQILSTYHVTITYGNFVQ